MGALDSPVPSAAAAGGGEAVASPSTAIATAPEQRLPTGPGGPLLTPADWAALAGTEVVIVDGLVQSTAASPPELPVDRSACGVDVALLAPAPVQVDAARYLTPLRDGGRVNEYALRFTDDDAAEAAVLELRRQYAACPALSASSDLGVPADRPLRGVGALFDDLFAAEATRADSELGPTPYTLLAARRANLVVVVESVNGWAERGLRTLLFAVIRAS